MRILVANKFRSPVGGVEAHAAAVIAWLEKSGHEVVPFAMDEEDAAPSEYSQYFPSAVDFRVTGPHTAVRAVERATRSSETRRKLAALLDAERIDAAYVLHVYHQLGTVVLNDLADRGIPTVLSLHDYKIGCPNYRLFSERTGRICTRCLDGKGASIWGPVVEGCWSGSRLAGTALSLEAAVTQVRGSYRRPGSVVVLNSLQERAAIAAGTTPSRIHRIAHPVTLGPPNSGKRNGRVLFVGRLVPEKGVNVLIEAAALSGVPVTIAGSGRCESELRELAEDLGAPVEFLGSVDHATVGVLMAEASALAVPSTWHEVSPLVVYEAMAADLPVIGSRVGGLAEQLADGRGLLVEAADVMGLADAMTRLTDDESLGKAMSAQARAYAEENLGPDRWSRNMVSAFRSAGAQEFTAHDCDGAVEPAVASVASAEQPKVVGDSWYAERLGGIQTVDGWLADRPVWLRSLVKRFPSLRGVALLIASRGAAAIVTSNPHPGTKLSIAVCGLLGLRRLVLLEYIVNPPRRDQRLRWLRRLQFDLVRKLLLPRCLLVAQVLTEREARLYPEWHGIPADRFELVRWPNRESDSALPELTGGNRVLASGRRVDWPTVFAAARGAQWDLRIVCESGDLPQVQALAQGVRAVVRTDITAVEHQEEVEAATVYVIAVPETGASIGQIRVMNANDAGTPLVASDVEGLREYVDETTAAIVPPADPEALRATVDALLADPDRRDGLRRGARRRSSDMTEFEGALRELAANAARRSTR